MLLGSQVGSLCVLTFGREMTDFNVAPGSDRFG